MNFVVYTLGCKVNSYESEFIKETFIKNNYCLVDNFKESDVIVINTCSVTNQSDAKSRKIIRHARKENKNAILVVCGCSAESKKEDLSDLDIDILIGNKDKSKIPLLVEEHKKDKKRIVRFYDLKNVEFEDMSINNFYNHTRGFVKIQDGCNNFCSYCIIPYTRGSVRNKDFDVALREIRCLVENGYHEIVLTGINTGSYNVNTKYDLVALIEEASKIPDLKRIRISSIEITELTDRFIECFKTNKKLCNHLHIPIQSASIQVLKDMGRKYDIIKYESILASLKASREDVNITTDMIVGYPTEDEKGFLESLKNASRFGFSKIHVFPYSKRNKTKSANLKEIDSTVKKNRVKQMIELSNKLEHDYYSSFIGRQVTVLIENNNTGFTSNYIKVILDRELENNTFVDCIITYVDGINVYGKVVEV